MTPRGLVANGKNKTPDSISKQKRPAALIGRLFLFQRLVLVEGEVGFELDSCTTDKPAFARTRRRCKFLLSFHL
jgi:hypothetical protein